MKEAVDSFQGIAMHGEGDIVSFKGLVFLQSFHLGGHPIVALFGVPMTVAVAGAQFLEATAFTLIMRLRVFFQNVHGIIPVPGHKMCESRPRPNMVHGSTALKGRWQGN